MRVADYNKHIKDVEQHARNAERSAAEVSNMLVKLNNRLHLEERKLLESKTMVAKAESHVTALRNTTSTLKRKLGALYKQYLEVSGKPVEFSRIGGTVNSEDAVVEKETLSADVGAFWRAQVHNCIFATSDPDLVASHFQLLEEMYGVITKESTAAVDTGPEIDVAVDFDIDPLCPLCPFEMVGRCNDVSCPYQHLDKDSASFGSRGSSADRRRALQRNIVRRTQPWLHHKTQTHGPAAARVDEGMPSVFTSSCTQPSWLQALLDQLGDVLCAGCSEAVDWGVTAALRLYRYSHHPETMLLCAQVLKRHLDAIGDGEKQEGASTVNERAAAWANYATVVARLNLDKQATMSLLSQVLREVYQKAPDGHLYHLAVLTEIDRLDPSFLLRLELSPSATQNQHFMLLLSQVRTLFERGLLLTAVNRLAQMLGLEPVFASRNQNALALKLDQHQRLVAWALLAFAVTTGEFAGLRLGVDPLAPFIPPPDIRAVVATLRQTLAGSAELGRKFRQVLFAAAAEIGVALDMDGEARAIGISRSATDALFESELPAGPVQCICFCILVLAEATSATVGGLEILQQLCPLNVARQIYPRTILESLLSGRPVDSTSNSSVASLPRMIAAAQAGLLAASDFDQLTADLDMLADRSLQHALEFWLAWRPKYVQGTLELTNFTYSLDKLCGVVRPMDFVSVIILSVQEVLSTSILKAYMVRALHVLVARSVQLLVQHTSIGRVLCAHVLGACEWLGNDVVSLLVVRYMELLERHDLLTVDTMSELLHITLQHALLPAPIFLWYEDWCNRGRLRHPVGKLLLMRNITCDLHRLRVETVAVFTRTLIASMDLEFPQLWHAVRALTTSHHHAGIAELIRTSFELGVKPADLHLQMSALLEGSTCAPLWDPHVPSELDQFALRKLLRVLCSDGSKSLVLRGSLPGMLPSCVLHLRQLEELALSHNSLVALPRCISRLCNLTILDLSFNALTTLPAELCDITTLKSLDASNNHLTAVPNEIRKLSNLRILRIQDNRLQSLPVGLLSLTGLRELDISNNLLQTVPRGLAERLSLSAFHAEGNPGFERTQST